jgi:plasmid stabilization system protein ParE
MALEIFWSKKADERFDEITDYLESEWGEKSARVFAKKVYDLLDILIELPEIGTIEKKELNIRGILVVKQITLFYQVRSTKLILLNFYDNRQGPVVKKY